VEKITLNLNTTAGKAGASKLCTAGIGSIEDERKKKIAKDFEGVLLNKVMDEMQNSVPESGLFEDETSKQTQSLFSMYMAQDVAAKGGMGFWKQIYAQMNETSGQSVPASTMDTTL
jgi:Rod binding domain-containing protein